MASNETISVKTGLSALELKQHLGLISCASEHREISADDIANIRHKDLDDVAGGFYSYLYKSLAMNGSPVFDDIRKSMELTPTGPNRKQPQFSSTDETRQATKDLLIGVMLDAKNFSRWESEVDSQLEVGVQTAAGLLLGALSSQHQAASGIQEVFDRGEIDYLTSRGLRRSEYIITANISVLELAVGTFPERYIIAAEHEQRQQ